jgi:hypothetical protein
VSATKATSSLYGTPIPKAGTAKRKPVPKSAAPAITGQFASVAKKIAKLSSDDVMQSLLRAGIITADGKLTAQYRKKKKKKKKK